MRLISEGIDRVRVFGLPAGVFEDGEAAGAPRLAIVRWWSAWADKLHQVYVGGRFAGTTLTCEQREMVVAFPSFGGRPVRVEVFAVSSADADKDLGDELEGSSARAGRVRIRFLRSQGLPAGAKANIYFDDGSGEIDYEKALNEPPARICGAWQDKAGSGMSGFGLGDYGYDSAAACGFGKGCFGHGQFGLDADAIEWVSAPLEAGTYRFAVKITDEFANESEASELEVTVNPAARPVEQLKICSFDKATNKLVLGMGVNN